MRLLRYFAVLLLILSVNNAFSKDSTLGFEFRGIEVSYGAYDIMSGVDLNFFHMDYLSYKPNLRYNVFNTTLKWGLLTEYYPLTQFGWDFWIFSDDAVNPYVVIGFQVPINFLALSFPLGMGFQIETFNDFYVGFRLYGDFLVAPATMASATWDFTFEYKL